MKMFIVQGVVGRFYQMIISVTLIFLVLGSYVERANASEIKVWKTKIGRLIAKKQVYPRAAMRKELEGKATVKVIIDRQGAITSYEVTKSSGHDVLDKEVPKLMKRLNPLPTPPAELKDSQLSITLPLSWMIN